MTHPSGKTKNSIIHLNENRNFRLAVREIITQSISRSASLTDLSADPKTASVGRVTSTNYLSSLSFRGRGKMSFIPQEVLNQRLRRPGATGPLQPHISQNQPPRLASTICSFIPQEILDQPLRRPRTTALPQLVSESSKTYPAKLTPFDQFFTNEPIDEIEIYRTMEYILIHDFCSLTDLEEIMEYLNARALESSTNVPTICKYLYVFSQDPAVGGSLRTAFYSSLENNFRSREKLKQREGPSRYRNFIRWVMAAAHHFRNLQYAPFDELLFGLLTLADEISSFEDSEDIPLYCILILRFAYYSTLPQSSTEPRELERQCEMAIKRARLFVRSKLLSGSLSADQSGWLSLVLEATWSKLFFEEQVTAHYEKILPSFSFVHPRSLNIRLPKTHRREKYLQHIKNYIILE